MFHDSTEANKRYTPDMQPESQFRQRIRLILGLHFDARDEKIYDELQRLKWIESGATSEGWFAAEWRKK